MAIMSSGSTELDARYLTTVSKAIKDVVGHFKREPASFLYEADLQGLLFARLFDGLSNSPLPLVPTDKPWAELANGQKLWVNPVKTEYPTGRRFDIALIVQEVRSEWKIWDQHVRAAIEIKFWQVDGTGGGFIRDLEKLNDYGKTAHEDGRQFTGICVVFCHRRDDPDLTEWVSEGKIIKNPVGLTLPANGNVAWAFTP